SQPLNFIGGAGNDVVDVNAGGSLLFAQAQQIHALNIAGGSVVLSAGRDRTLSLDALTIDANGRLDLSDNAMIVRSGGSAAVADLTAKIKSGFNLGGTLWAGNGITTN